jgi:hypothetical protein
LSVIDSLCEVCEQPESVPFREKGEGESSATNYSERRPDARKRQNEKKREC